MNSYISIDIETTGFGITAKIIELAAIKVINGNISDRFQSFVNIGKPLPQEIIRLTNIRDNDLICAPDIKTALTELKNFIGNMPIIGYNIAFDMSFIKRCGDENGISFDNESIDVLILAREKLFNTGILTNYHLSTVAEYFGITFTAHRVSNAAEATIEIYKRLREI